MIFADVVQLVKQSEGAGAFGEQTETTRQVYCTVKSVTRNEFYLATAQNLKPDIVFVLTDYADYHNEEVALYHGERYTVIRTYRKGFELEIVCQRRAGS